MEITTPKGGVRARAAFNGTLAPNVVCGQHGWFEPCEELDLPGYPPFGAGSANLNLVLSQTPSDPISGTHPFGPRSAKSHGSSTTNSSREAASTYTDRGTAGSMSRGGGI